MKGAEGAVQIAKMMDDLRNIHLRSSEHGMLLSSEIIRRMSVQLLLQARRSLQDFLNLTYFILNLMTMHGAVQDLQEQSLRLSSTWALRAQAWKTHRIR